MRYSLLQFLRCVSCGGELSLLPEENRRQENDNQEIQGGFLSCGGCGRWFPIREFIPELLPDRLRNWPEDLIFLEALKDKIPGELFQRIREKSREIATAPRSDDGPGDRYKKAEMSIETKIDNPAFFGPGMSLPFNPWDTEDTMCIIRRLGNVLPFLEVTRGEPVLDGGPAYAWTTEWLAKMGLNAIGVDICRTYMDIGMRRMEDMIRKGSPRPHLIVADIEDLPLRDRAVKAVFFFNSFHHIHDRKTAMGHLYRVLKETGNIVLVEPGGMHEYAGISREAASKFGILEEGMELKDVRRYCQGLEISPPEQHFVLRIQSTEIHKIISPDFVLTHSYSDCNIFVVKKRPGQACRTVRPSSKLMLRLKQRLKRQLRWLFVKIFH